ncbi:hypothetical protein M422DRAFT_201351 [Sphaerobolus stellatus SS14]|nr:hypothetical protein M422DRAFT_201351 [Sphaerobolus stellatus SS14]
MLSTLHGVRSTTALPTRHCVRNLSCVVAYPLAHYNFKKKSVHTKKRVVRNASSSSKVNEVAVKSENIPQKNELAEQPRTSLEQTLAKFRELVCDTQSPPTAKVGVAARRLPSDGASTPTDVLHNRLKRRTFLATNLKSPIDEYQSTTKTSGVHSETALKDVQNARDRSQPILYNDVATVETYGARRDSRQFGRNSTPATMPENCMENCERTILARERDVADILAMLDLNSKVDAILSSQKGESCTDRTSRDHTVKYSRKHAMSDHPFSIFTRKRDYSTSVGRGGPKSAAPSLEDHPSQTSSANQDSSHSDLASVQRFNKRRATEIEYSELLTLADTFKSIISNHPDSRSHSENLQPAAGPVQTASSDNSVNSSLQPENWKGEDWKPESWQDSWSDVTNSMSVRNTSQEEQKRDYTDAPVQHKKPLETNTMSRKDLLDKFHSFLQDTRGDSLEPRRNVFQKEPPSVSVKTELRGSSKSSRLPSSKGLRKRRKEEITRVKEVSKEKDVSKKKDVSSKKEAKEAFLAPPPEEGRKRQLEIIQNKEEIAPLRRASKTKEQHPAVAILTNAIFSHGAFRKAFAENLARAEMRADIPNVVSPVFGVGEDLDSGTFARSVKSPDLLQDIVPANAESRPIAQLQHGLDRVLFNQTVHWLQDPHSRVFNFSPYLQTIPSVTDFAFERLPQYQHSSEDATLRDLASVYGKPFVGTTSSLTRLLAHIYFLLSEDKPVDTSTLSMAFADKPRTMSPALRLPYTFVLRHRRLSQPCSDGTPGLTFDSYAVETGSALDPLEKRDSDLNVLIWLGTAMEKFLTMPAEEFTYLLRKNDPHPDGIDTRREAYRYAKTSKFVMRSQLDCQDSRLPGTGVFDLKTRAVLPIRIDQLNYEDNTGYRIRTLTGEYESFEREYYDLIRSAFLKYNFQARIGEMDGIMVAYHNTARQFGFQYIPVREMEERLYGPGPPERGRRIFEQCVEIMEALLEQVVSRFPGQTITCTVDTKMNSNECLVWCKPSHSPQPNGPIELLQLTLQNRLGEKDISGGEAIAMAANESWNVKYSIKRSRKQRSEIWPTLSSRMQQSKEFKYILPEGVTEAQGKRSLSAVDWAAGIGIQWDPEDRLSISSPDIDSKIDHEQDEEARLGYKRLMLARKAVPMIRQIRRMSRKGKKELEKEALERRPSIVYKETQTSSS